MAREVAHLVLPYGHSTTGLMRADWDAKDMRLAVHRRLNFTREQSRTDPNQAPSLWIQLPSRDARQMEVL